MENIINNPNISKTKNVRINDTANNNFLVSFIDFSNSI